MQFAKGWFGARWNASDENGDKLDYRSKFGRARRRLETARREGAREAHELRFHGVRGWRIPRARHGLGCASNIREEALTASEISAPFLIDNTPPAITGLRVSGLRLTWHAADALSLIARAEYAVDGGEWTMVDPVGRLSDSRELDYALAVAPGHSIAVRVTDEYGNTAVASVR